MEQNKLQNNSFITKRKLVAHDKYNLVTLMKIYLFQPMKNGANPLCILCMSLCNTPYSDHQLISKELNELSCIQIESLDSRVFTAQCSLFPKHFHFT